MINNKKLALIIIGLLPIVVISFVFKSNETNFNLEKDNENNLEDSFIDEKIVNNAIIKVLVNEEVKSLPLEEYILGVVAGEMPASFESEALKAQAVASRTYALYKKSANEGGEYDLTDNTNNQVYLSEEDMRKKWGDDYQKYYNKIKEAVDTTSGEVITYDGEIIESFYFAMSAGNTLDVSSVFNETRDYLKSVESIYDNNDLKNYEVTVTFEKNDFKKKLELTCEDIVIDDIKYNEVGYVDSISVCSKIFKGTEFRNKLGLRSANFTVAVGNEVSVVTKGYGHAVGMSQYGANGYANHGYTYEDIIKHYYTGVEITKL